MRAVTRNCYYGLIRLHTGSGCATAQSSNEHCNSAHKIISCKSFDSLSSLDVGHPMKVDTSRAPHHNGVQIQQTRSHHTPGPTARS